MLTRFEEKVFKKMLTQMANSSIGHLSVNGSEFNIYISISVYKKEISRSFCLFLLDPFDCKQDPCHLAWLIRDGWKLLDYLYFATCSNGTLFKHLNPNGFKKCPSSSTNSTAPMLLSNHITYLIVFLLLLTVMRSSFLIKLSVFI